MKPNLSVEKVVKEIDQRIEKIWNRPPLELKRLLEVKGPLRKPFNVVIYAYWDANALASTLWTLRHNAKTGVPVGPLAIITKSILENHIRSFEAYGLPDTVTLLRKVSDVQPQVKESKEYILVVERLIVYLNRLGMAGWLDLMVPWKELGETFEKVIRPEKFNWGSG